VNVRYSITLKSEKLAYMKMLMGCKPELQRQYNNTVARLKGYRTLEPYEAKVSRTVLKGLETGNGLRLLNIEIPYSPSLKEGSATFFAELKLKRPNSINS